MHPPPRVRILAPCGRCGRAVALAVGWSPTGPFPAYRLGGGARAVGPQAHSAPRRCPTEGRISTEDEPAEAGSKNKNSRPEPERNLPGQTSYALKNSTKLFTFLVRHCGVGATSQ